MILRKRLFTGVCVSWLCQCPRPPGHTCSPWTRGGSRCEGVVNDLQGLGLCWVIWGKVQRSRDFLGIGRCQESRVIPGLVLSAFFLKGGWPEARPPGIGKEAAVTQAASRGPGLDEVHSAPVPTGLCGGLVAVLLPHEAVGWPRVGLRGAVRGQWKAASSGCQGGFSPPRIGRKMRSTQNASYSSAPVTSNAYLPNE